MQHIFYMDYDTDIAPLQGSYGSYDVDEIDELHTFWPVRDALLELLKPISGTGRIAIPSILDPKMAVDWEHISRSAARATITSNNLGSV